MSTPSVRSWSDFDVNQPAPIHPAPLSIRFNLFLNGTQPEQSVCAVSPGRFKSWERGLLDLTRVTRPHGPVSGHSGQDDDLRTGLSLVAARRVQCVQQLRPIDAYVRVPAHLLPLSFVTDNPPEPKTHVESRRKLSMYSLPLLANNTSWIQSSRKESPSVFQRFLTVIRNAPRPRKAIRFTLNDKANPSMEAVLKDLTRVLRFPVKHLFNSETGKPVRAASQLITNSRVFIASEEGRIEPEDLLVNTDEIRAVSAYRRPTQRTRVTLQPPGIYPRLASDAPEASSRPSTTGQAPHKRRANRI